MSMNPWHFYVFFVQKQISYSALTIWIVQIVFWNQKMNEYQYLAPTIQLVK